MPHTPITVEVPVPHLPFPVRLHTLTPLLDEDDLTRVDEQLRTALAWSAFRADWITRTGRSPAAERRDRAGRGFPVSLTRGRLTHLRPDLAAAASREDIRILRCCRAAYWYFGLERDPTRWNTAARLLEQRWPANDIDLIRVVQAITDRT